MSLLTVCCTRVCDQPIALIPSSLSYCALCNEQVWLAHSTKRTWERLAPVVGDARVYCLQCGIGVAKSATVVVESQEQQDERRAIGQENLALSFAAHFGLNCIVLDEKQEGK